ncbi:MAG: thiamine diphosphokinase [Chloroflexi bacterium]|nr:thiamine diphosphokinase [Chloroflexota bacterium]
MSRVLIFKNGELPDPDSVRGLIQDDDFILSVDGGTRHVLSLGRIPHLVVGDLDSIVPQDRTKLDEMGVDFVVHPKEKDQTDLELAIEIALSRNPAKILLLAALGGRLDHTLGNISLLTDPRLETIETALEDGRTELQLCRHHVRIIGQRGDLVSLIPWKGDVLGVSTENLQWELEDETLFQNRTRGVSNEMLGDMASIQVRSGFLLVIHIRQEPQEERRRL